MEKHFTYFQYENNIISTIVQRYQRTEETLAEDVENIKSWMKSQPHLPEILDDKIIQNFLIFNKCSVEKAKQRIDMYYTMRSRMPDFYVNINPTCSNLKKMWELIYHIPLPKPTKEMYRVYVSKYRTKDMVDQIDPWEVTKIGNNLHEIRLMEDVVYGDIIIFDVEGTCVKLLSKMTPVFMINVLTLYTKIYSLRVKGIYIVNSVPYIDTVVELAKRFVKPKLLQRLHICRDTSILSQHFPLEILPKDYGGEEKSLEELRELCNLKFEEHRERFDLLDKLRVNEDLRPKTLENDEDLGYYGNFKKLRID